MAELRSLEPGALVVLQGDLQNNVAKYAQSCEGVRTDLLLASLPYVRRTAARASACAHACVCMRMHMHSLCWC